MTDHNLFVALRRGFPEDRERIAIDAADSQPQRFYTWRDLDCASGRLANWLASLGLPPASRVWDPLESTCRHASLSIL